jgi:hypothetical protein
LEMQGDVSDMYCPRCRSELAERAVLDPNLKGYVCKNGDAFYETLIDQTGGIPRADTIQPPLMNDDIQTLKFWLSDKDARKRLPNQLALACRRIVEIVEGNLHVAAVDNPFAFCPTCGKTLARFDSDDLYMQGLRCANDHEFWWRGSTVQYVARGVRTNLSAELDDDFLRTLIAYYTSDDECLEPYVHPQLRRVLARFGK